MRKLNYYLFIILINIITLTTTGQNKIEKQNTLRITGAALLNNQYVNDYSMSVYLDGTRIDSIYSESKSPIKFILPGNQVFTVLFQKQNCLDKIVIVNTQTPKSFKKAQSAFYNFEVELSESLSKSSKDIEDNGIAILMINDNNKLSESTLP